MTKPKYRQFDPAIVAAQMDTPEKVATCFQLAAVDIADNRVKKIPAILKSMMFASLYAPDQKVRDGALAFAQAAVSRGIIKPQELIKDMGDLAADERSEIHQRLEIVGMLLDEAPFSLSAKRGPLETFLDDTYLVYMDFDHIDKVMSLYEKAYRKGVLTDEHLERTFDRCKRNASNEGTDKEDYVWLAMARMMARVNPDLLKNRSDVIESAFWLVGNEPSGSEKVREAAVGLLGDAIDAGDVVRKGIKMPIWLDFKLSEIHFDAQDTWPYAGRMAVTKMMMEKAPDYFTNGSSLLNSVLSDVLVNNGAYEVGGAVVAEAIKQGLLSAKTVDSIMNKMRGRAGLCAQETQWITMYCLHSQSDLCKGANGIKHEIFAGLDAPHGREIAERNLRVAFRKEVISKYDIAHFSFGKSALVQQSAIAVLLDVDPDSRRDPDIHQMIFKGLGPECKGEAHTLAMDNFRLAMHEPEKKKGRKLPSPAPEGSSN